MARSSIVGFWRQYGSSKKSATPVPFIAGLKFAFSPTQSSATVSKVLPKGAIPIGVRSFGGATGGTLPTVDVGTSGDSDGFANELDADTLTGETTTGALLGTELTADTIVFAGVGASAATGGTTTVILEYIMADDGSA